MSLRVTVVGGGLAGSEAALVLARLGINVQLLEMRPECSTEAHETPDLAELVCSNSLRSNDETTAPGLLKSELRKLGSPLLMAAEECRVPAGSALAVDRRLFSQAITRTVESTHNIEVVRTHVSAIPNGPAVILAPGPLCSKQLMDHVAELIGKSYCFFFDAIAPIIDSSSIDYSKVFVQSRYDEGEGDYLNAPMSESEYFAFVQALLTAEQHSAHLPDDSKASTFTACEPVEDIASRGILSLAHGPMRPTGLTDPATGRRPFAVVQLRAENRDKTCYNLVGFQSKLKQSEQLRVFRMIPGLGSAEFLRFGSVHRNSYLDSPRVLNQDLSMQARQEVLVAGQFCGAEGYVESIATGHLAALFASARLRNEVLQPPPLETALGALLNYVTTSTVQPLQPSHVHFGLFPPMNTRGPKSARRSAQATRGVERFDQWLAAQVGTGLLVIPGAVLYNHRVPV